MTKTSDDVTDDSLYGFDRAQTPLSTHHYDPDDDGDLTTAIISAVAEAEGVELTEVTEPLLYDSVDAGALEESLFDTDRGTGIGDQGEVAFEYHSFVVTVDCDGWISVYETPSD